MQNPMHGMYNSSCKWHAGRLSPKMARWQIIPGKRRAGGLTPGNFAMAGHPQEMPRWWVTRGKFRVGGLFPGKCRAGRFSPKIARWQIILGKFRAGSLRSSPKNTDVRWEFTRQVPSPQPQLTAAEQPDPCELKETGRDDGTSRRRLIETHLFDHIR